MVSRTKRSVGKRSKKTTNIGDICLALFGIAVAIVIGFTVAADILPAAIVRIPDAQGRIVHMDMNDGYATTFDFTYDALGMTRAIRTSNGTAGTQVLTMDLRTNTATQTIGTAVQRTYDLTPPGTDSPLLAQWLLVPGGQSTTVYGRMTAVTTVQGGLTMSTVYTYDGLTLTNILRTTQSGAISTSAAYDFVNLRATRTFTGGASQTFDIQTSGESALHAAADDDLFPLGTIPLSANGSRSITVRGTLRQIANSAAGWESTFDEFGRPSLLTTVDPAGTNLALQSQTQFTYDGEDLVQIRRTGFTNAGIPILTVFDASTMSTFISSGDTVQFIDTEMGSLTDSIQLPAEYKIPIRWSVLTPGGSYKTYAVYGKLRAVQTRQANQQLRYFRIFPDYAIEAVFLPNGGPVSARAVARNADGTEQWSAAYGQLAAIPADAGSWSEPAGSQLMIEPLATVTTKGVTLARYALYGTSIRTCLQSTSNCLPVSNGTLSSVPSDGWGVNARALSPNFWYAFSGSIAVGNNGKWNNPMVINSPALSGAIAGLDPSILRIGEGWSGIQPRRSSGSRVWYTFSGTTVAMNYLRDRGARPLFILGGTHPGYDNGLPPFSPAGRQAFLRAINELVTRFANRSVLWELGNEPNNNEFWLPQPDAQIYLTLAKELALTVRAADPTATIIGPGLSRFDMEYAEELMRQNFLLYIDAFTFHPYRQGVPEQALDEMDTLRYAIQRYAPPDRKNLPIANSEVGWSGRGNNETKQAMFDARQWLVGAVEGLRMNVMYDLMDAPYGTSGYQGLGMLSGTTLNTEEKPAFIALRSLMTELKDYRVVHRLSSANNEWTVVFEKNGSFKVVTWSADPVTGGSLPSVRNALPEEIQNFQFLSNVKYSATWVATGNGMPGTFSLTFRNTAATQATIVAAVGDEQRTVSAPAGSTVTAFFTLHPSGDRTRISTPVPVSVTWNGIALAGLPPVRNVHPAVLDITGGREGNDVRAFLVNPSKMPFFGTLSLVQNGTTVAERTIQTSGQNAVEVRFENVQGQYSYVLVDSSGEVVLETGPRSSDAIDWASRAPQIAYDQLTVRFSWSGTTLLDPAGQVAALRAFHGAENITVHPTTISGSLAIGLPPDGDSTFSSVLNMSHRFFGLGQVRLGLTPHVQIPAGAKAARVWIWSDQERNRMMSWYRDANQELFQHEVAKLIWSGWQSERITLGTLDADTTSYHPNPTINDGIVQLPMDWSDFLRVHSLSTHPMDGTISIAPTIEWEY